MALLLDEDRRAVAAAARETKAIARAARLVADAVERGHDIVFAGAGTSGRMGILEAAECPPTFGSDPRRIRAVMAGGKASVFRAKEGAEDREQDGRREAERLRRGDVLIGISASSVTPFVRAALAAARRKGAATALVTCAPVKGLGRLADVVIAIATGPEVLTGSTRLKAGSATKAVLNAITTAAMVRMGKAYGSLMVDLRRTSAKLVDRARRIVMAGAHVDARTADRLLDASGGEAKTAIVMAGLDVGAPVARRRLASARGHVHKALSRRTRRDNRLTAGRRPPL